MLPKNKNIDWKNKLCTHQPDESVWIKIEKQLDFDAHLAMNIPELPIYQPDMVVWEHISVNLHNNKTISLRFKIVSIAASIAIIMLLSTIMLQLNNENLHKTTGFSNIALTESDMEQDAISEIRNYCNLNMPVCEQTNFKELIQLYEELKVEESELKKAMNQLGDSPEMIQAMIKIENLKSETIQNMILLIQS